ncbi:hypothetical protein CH63R_10770 [Colletotrichum higginsianum IMI 349063]|uniref:Uncharacterized protein n=2 Tax=Colletotrichum higginsianum TaxID=80884 RepID=A0A1B7Y3Q1_COLHI|nr:uncharacterized protein CH63R_10770 [Colletotrichum higginsianum IMI 349063]OBR06650.1 hypothetical protein CH63R_10770 [Colletotrichum higginsianum IMI 349063]TIC97872.1 hypothetical protein CH35J_007551 [Colletotrichum higginsianum]GJD04528.1 hypothetical protein ColKHC_13353 [Colletotrichum higginsianum]
MRADNDDNAALSADEDLLRDNEEPSSTAFVSPPLPQLTNEPQTLPDSCVSLSRPFLRALHALLPPSPHLTLSIGSGTGLVEALLHGLAPPPNLVSVEVAPSPNRYHAAHRTVPGTWALEPLAARARAWVFVYPKQVALVRAYVEAFLGRRDAGAEVEVVVYVGPRMDWDDFRGALEEAGVAGEVEVEVWGEERMEAVGGRAWECVAVVRPRGRSAPKS